MTKAMANVEVNMGFGENGTIDYTKFY